MAQAAQTNIDARLFQVVTRIHNYRLLQVRVVVQVTAAARARWMRTVAIALVHHLVKNPWNDSPPDITCVCIGCTCHVLNLCRLPLCLDGCQTCGGHPHHSSDLTATMTSYVLLIFNQPKMSAPSQPSSVLWPAKLVQAALTTARVSQRLGQVRFC